MLTDYDVVEYKRIFKDNNLISEVTETSDYRVTFLLEDGFWRIRHMVKLESRPFGNETVQDTLKLHIKGINYYPQATAWDMYGDNFDANTIAKDFKIINTFKVFDNPNTIELTPDNKYLYVSCRGKNAQETYLTRSPNNGKIVVIDLDKKKILYSIFRRLVKILFIQQFKHKIDGLGKN